MKITVKELQAICDKFNKEADGHNFVCPNNPDDFTKFMMEWKRDCKGDIKKLTKRTYLNSCKWINTTDLGAYRITFAEMEDFNHSGNARRKKLS